MNIIEELCNRGLRLSLGTIVEGTYSADITCDTHGDFGAVGDSIGDAILNAVIVYMECMKEINNNYRRLSTCDIVPCAYASCAKMDTKKCRRWNCGYCIEWSTVRNNPYCCAHKRPLTDDDNPARCEHFKLIQGYRNQKEKQHD